MNARFAGRAAVPVSAQVKASMAYAPEVADDRMTTVRVPGDVAEKLTAAAAAAGVSRSALLKDAIEVVANGDFVPKPSQPEVRLSVRTKPGLMERAGEAAKQATGSDRGLNSAIVEALRERLAD